MTQFIHSRFWTPRDWRAGIYCVTKSLHLREPQVLIWEHRETTLTAS